MSDINKRDDRIQETETRTRNRIRILAANCVTKAFGFSLFMTFGAIFCQGFALWGFHLSETFLNWLGVATVGQIATLFAMVLRQK